MNVFLYEQVLWVEADTAEPRVLHRQKRSWIIPPKKLFENVDYTQEDFIAKVSIYTVKGITLLYGQLLHDIITPLLLMKQTGCIEILTLNVFKGTTTTTIINTLCVVDPYVYV